MRAPAKRLRNSHFENIAIIRQMDAYHRLILAFDAGETQLHAKFVMYGIFRPRADRMADSRFAHCYVGVIGFIRSNSQQRPRLPFI